MEPQGARTGEPALGIISAKMAKALASDLRCDIVAKLSVRPMSASEFAEDTRYELSQASRGFRQLAAYGYLEVIEERTGGKRRGGVERVYRKTQRAHFDSPSWEQLPRILREDITGNLLSGYLDRIQEAIEAETLEAETDRHLSWDSALLDRQAWTELMTHLDWTLHWIPQLVVESAERMAETGEEPIPTTVGLAGFRSPKAPKRK
jgi:DNA-binding transcriptional ArsR family regulator